MTPSSRHSEDLLEIPLGGRMSIAIVADAALIVVAYLYSRFLFSEYLRRHHRKQWEEMVYGQEYRGLNVLAFDKTPALWRFRCESRDNLGDPRAYLGCDVCRSISSIRR